MEPNGEPLWFQPPSRRRPQPTPLFNPVALILTIPLLILLILFFLLPSFLSHTLQFLRPNSVKKSWDSLNIVLVLFAILCGVFARWNDESRPSDAGHPITNGVSRPRQSVSAWTDFPEYNSSGSGGGIRLRRSSSSYPDLRQESLWDSGGGNTAVRFFDDFEVNFHRSPPPMNFQLRRHEAETIVSEIPVDKFEISSDAAAPPTPPPPPPKANLKRRRSLRSVPRKEKQSDEAEVSIKQRPVTPPAPPLPPAPAPATEAPEYQNTEEPSVEVHRKKSGPTKDFATAIASFYKGQRKRKKRVKSRNIYESAAESSSPPSAVEPPSTPPPPPPPPPTSKVFQNPFKRSTKNKRVHSVSTTAPPPPPPPPPSSIFNTIFKTGNKSSRFKNVTTAPSPAPPPPEAFPRRRQLNSGKPPKPTKQSTLYQENVRIAPPSPLIPLPPPPPPFRMAKAKFVARGDYVRIRSSRCSSPELEDVEVMSVKSEGGDSISWPSPDVNAKADSFIARLRDEWRLEKMNSVKEKRRF